MKNLITAIFCLITVYGTAQITYGVKAGVNVSKMDEIHTGSEKRVGIYAGGFATIPLQDYNTMYYIQPELLYTQMGEKEDATEDVKIDYIAIPVLFKTYFSENDTEFFGEIGPQIGFLISEELPNSDLQVDQNGDKILEYQTLDYGLNIGLGFSYIRKWEFSARFYYGLADVVEGKVGEIKNGELTYDDPKNINSNVNFGVAYRF